MLHYKVLTHIAVDQIIRIFQFRQLPIIFIPLFLFDLIIMEHHLLRKVNRQTLQYVDNEHYVVEVHVIAEVLSRVYSEYEEDYFDGLGVGVGYVCCVEVGDEELRGVG